MPNFTNNSFSSRAVQFCCIFPNPTVNNCTRDAIKMVEAIGAKTMISSGSRCTPQVWCNQTTKRPRSSSSSCYRSVPRGARRSRAGFSERRSSGDEGASAFDAESSDLSAYIDALTRDIDAVARDVVGSVFSRVASALPSASLP